MKYSPLGIKDHFKKVDDRTVGISDLPLKFQGSTVTIDFDDVGTYKGPFVVKCFLASEFLEGFDLAPIRRALNSCVNIFNLYGCF